MKIALITYHYSSNNGATMQTYALCRYLKELGHDLQIIDIRQDENWPVPFYVRVAKVLIQERRIKLFMRNHFPPLTHRYKTLEELQNDFPEADCYIVGSDQTWNPAISKDLCLAYFLDFGKENIRRISYASSFGIKVWPRDEQRTERVKSCLERFYALSVREQEGADLCARTFGIKPRVVLDPCFLNDDYKELLGQVKQKNQIVCYKLNKTFDFYSNMPALKEQLQLPALLLNENYPQKGFKYVFNPGVEKWLRTLAGAKFVVTDSFHGAVFSIIFHRQFIVTLNHDSKDSRLMNLMRSMGLENYMLENLSDIKKDNRWQKEINWDEVEKKKSELVMESRNYLLNALR
jgi:polysaccharide pyruvyl transferase WcaK-like protein